ncbi:TlpA family protein disulfide reductase [Ningiella sp. W23]|uniref:TlpA family protein disulfide reductase n=1 Tax=Ningiella sp. W23 TaxID=3023715 RepID=UPI0037573336
MPESSSASGRKLLLWLRDIAIFAVVIFAVMAWQSRNMLDSDGSVSVPQSQLVTLSGEVKPMLVTDKPNLIYFFAPWCQICALSIDNLEYLNKDRVNVVVIALDYQSQEEIEAFVSEHAVLAEVFMGTQELKQRFQIQGYPSYYLLDESGAVVSSSFGYSTAVGLKLREVFGA